MSEKFGEPWSDFTGGIYGDGLLIIRPDGFVESCHRLRAVRCVNALAGIEDPEAWVKAAKELFQKSSAIIQRLEQIHNDPHYQSVWQQYALHGGDYTDGPKYADEMQSLIAALASCEAAEGRKG